MQGLLSPLETELGGRWRDLWDQLGGSRLLPTLKNPNSSLTTWCCCCCLVIKLCLTLGDPMDFSLTRLLCPWDFPGKNTGSWWPFLSPGALSDPGIRPPSPALAGEFFTAGPPGKPHNVVYCYHNPTDCQRAGSHARRSLTWAISRLAVKMH